MCTRSPHTRLQGWLKSGIAGLARLPTAWKRRINYLAVLAITLLAVIPLALPASAQEVTPAKQARFETFVRQLRDCKLGSGQVLRIAVLGLPDGEIRLTRRQKDLAIHTTSTGLASQNGVRIVPAGQIQGLLQYRAATEETFNDKKIRRLMRGRRVADAVVTMRFHDEASGAITLGIEAVTLNLECAVRGDVALNTKRKKYGSDLNALFAAFARKVVARSDGNITVSEFRSDTGLDTDCDIALQTRMGRAFEDVNASVNAQVSGRKNRIVLSESSSVASEDGTVVTGRFGVNGDNPANRQIWVEVGAKSERESIALEPRTFVFGNYCDPRPREFLTAVMNEARTDNGILQVFSENGGRFRVGDPFSVSIYSKQAGTLYCWYLSADRTGYILTPNAAAPQSQTIKANSTLRFPSDFGFDPWNFEEPSDDLFSCFLPERALPEDLLTEWNENWFGKNNADGGTRKIGTAQIRKLARLMRAQPSIVEGHVRLVIQP